LAVSFAEQPFPKEATMAAGKKTLCISDEILLDEDGTPTRQALPLISAALKEWRGVVVFTRRPGVAKRQLSSLEAHMRSLGCFYGEEALVKRIEFSMKRPPGSTLLAEKAICWDGSLPKLVLS
jgi:hypothetical protein